MKINKLLKVLFPFIILAPLIGFRFITHNNKTNSSVTTQAKEINIDNSIIYYPKDEVASFISYKRLEQLQSFLNKEEKRKWSDQVDLKRVSDLEFSHRIKLMDKTLKITKFLKCTCIINYQCKPINYKKSWKFKFNNDFDEGFGMANIIDFFYCLDDVQDILLPKKWNWCSSYLNNYVVPSYDNDGVEYSYSSYNQ